MHNYANSLASDYFLAWVKQNTFLILTCRCRACAVTAVHCCLLLCQSKLPCA